MVIYFKLLGGGRIVMQAGKKLVPVNISLEDFPQYFHEMYVAETEREFQLSPELQQRYDAFLQARDAEMIRNLDLFFRRRS